MAAVYILSFPVGTILSFVMFKGLGRYLDSLDRMRATMDVPMAKAVDVPPPPATSGDT